MKTATIARWGCLGPAVAFFLLLVASFIATEYRMSEGMRKLPPTASDIQEEEFHGIIGGDHRGLTRAMIPKETYAEYARALNLTTRFDPEFHAEIESRLNTKVGDAPSWWNPPAVDQTAYFDYSKGRTYLRVLRYHEGFVYYLRLSW